LTLKRIIYIGGGKGQHGGGPRGGKGKGGCSVPKRHNVEKSRGGKRRKGTQVEGKGEKIVGSYRQKCDTPAWYGFTILEKDI